MEKNNNFNSISDAIKYGVDKKFCFADISFETTDGEITEEMEKIATQKKAKSILVYEIKNEISNFLSIVPVLVHGKVYTRGLFSFKDGYCEELFLKIYVHDGGVELVRKSSISFSDRSMKWEDDGQFE